MSRRRRVKRERKELVIPIGHKVVFDYEEVKRLAKENGLQVYLKGNGTVLEIKSKINTWICSTDTEDVINLYHLTYDGGKHFQRSFLDYKFLFESVKRHDEFKTMEDKKNRVFNIFKMLNTGSVPRIRMV